MSSSPQLTMAGGRPGLAGVPGTRRRPVIVLGAEPTQPVAWWIDPIPAILFLVLPVFCAASYYNRFNYWTYNASRDFVTTQTFTLGLYSLAMIVLGVAVGRTMIRRTDTISLIDAERAETILVRLGWVAIVAYAILLGTLLNNLDIVLDLLRGDASAPNRLRFALGRIPGVTSFVQFGNVYLALVATLVAMTRFRMTPRLWTMTGVILGLIFLRSILASERLALLEGLASAGVIPLAYRWRPSIWRIVAPYLGVVVVFAAFAGAEYLRSWQYYRAFYDNYLDFIGPRFAGYFSTSINNGAGAYLTAGQYAPHPEITVGWITKFPVLGSFLPAPEITMMDEFLEKYATPEFNNPGGLYAAFLDYPFPVATVFLIGIGAVIGAVHRSFKNKTLTGMLLYPAVFLGMTDLIRVMYISDTRTLPLFLGVFVTVWAIRPITVPRHQFLGMAAGTGASTGARAAA